MSALALAWTLAALVILVWGMTFANTRALLTDFSALEILVVRFVGDGAVAPYRANLV